MARIRKEIKDWKKVSKEEYEAEKDRLLELVLPHYLFPDWFDCQRLTHEEIAVLISPDQEHILTKMAICKTEAAALRKIRARLAKYGIRRLSDVLETDKYRTVAKAVKEHEQPG